MPNWTHEELLADMTWLSRLARGLVRDPATADDAVQEAWLAATRRLRARGDGGRPDRGHLARALRSVVGHAGRALGRRRFHEARAVEGRALPSTAELLELGEAQKRLWNHVAGLEEPFRTTLLLRFQRGLEVGDLARELGLREDSVRWRLRRGLALLRASIEREDGPRGLAALVPVAIAAVHPRGAVARSAAGTFPSAALGAAGSIWMLKNHVALVAAAVLALLGSVWIVSESSVPADLAGSAAGTEAEAVELAGALPGSERDLARPDADAERREVERETGAASDAGEAPSKARVTGRVVDSSGDPRTNVEVRIERVDLWRRTTTTAADGTFELLCPQAPASTAVLRVPGDRFHAPARLWMGPGEGCEFGPVDGDELDVGDLTQVEVAVLVGRVVDPTGAPVPEASVFLPHYTAGTDVDSDGAFTLGGARAETGVVIVSAPGWRTALPGIDVVPGRVVDVGELVLERGPSVSGRVVDGAGNPIPTATVHAPRNEVTVRPDGTFEIRGASEVVVPIHASAPGRRDSLDMWCQPGAEVELVLPPEGDPCRFVVVDAETGAPVEGIAVALEEISGQVLQAAGDEGRRFAASIDGERDTTDAEGAIEIPGRPGVDRILVETKHHLPLRVSVEAAATTDAGQVLRLERQPRGTVVGSVPPGVAISEGRVGFQILERWASAADPARPWTRWIPAGDADSDAIWADAATAVRDASTLKANVRDNGTFERTVRTPSAVRAVVRLPGRRALVSEVARVLGDGVTDLGSLVEVDLGAIEIEVAADRDLTRWMTMCLDGRRRTEVELDDQGVVRFDAVLPGTHRIHAAQMHDAFDPAELARIVVVRPGETTRIRLEPQVPELARVRFEVRRNGRPIEDDHHVTVVAAGRRFDAYAEDGASTTETVLLPVGFGHSVSIGLDLPGGSNAECELSRTVDVLPGEQTIRLECETCRVTCALPKGWSHPDGPGWQILRWTDSAGVPHGPIDAANHLLVRPVPGAASGRLEVHFAMVPVDARELTFVVQGRGEKILETWTFEAELVAGGHVFALVGD